jgi:hypothetical protein
MKRIKAAGNKRFSGSNKIKIPVFDIPVYINRKKRR